MPTDSHVLKYFQVNTQISAENTGTFGFLVLEQTARYRTSDLLGDKRRCGFFQRGNAQQNVQRSWLQR